MSKVVVPFLRSAFNYDRDAASLDVALPVTDDGLTQQSFADEVDINTIVRRFGLTGEMPQNPRTPLDIDFAGVVDFQTAVNAVKAAQDGFMEFPAELRAQFDNDPQLLMDFVADSGNRDAAIELGLIPRPPEVTRDAVAAIDELAARFPAPPPVDKK